VRADLAVTRHANKELRANANPFAPAFVRAARAIRAARLSGTAEHPHQRVAETRLVTREGGVRERTSRHREVSRREPPDDPGGDVT